MASRLRRHGGPVVVWIVAVVAVAVLLSNQAAVIEAPGLVTGRSIKVSPVEPGVLASLEVELLDEVRQGQVLARMDEGRLRAEAAVVAAEVEAVRSELLLDLAGRRQDTATERRRFAIDVEASRLEVLEILAMLEPDRVTLADLQRDVDSYRQLLDQELVSVREFERVQAEHDALDTRVAEQQALLTRAQADLQEAEARREAFFNRPGADDASEAAAAEAVVTARVTALERRLETVLLRCSDLALTAPFSGVVTRIPACSGQVMQPGDVVLTLAEATPEEIVVWLDESAVRRLQRDGELEATVTQSLGARQVRARCPVSRIGPVVETLPEELWPTVDRPLRGRPVVLAVPAGMQLVPGEQVSVRWG